MRIPSMVGREISHILQYLFLLRIIPALEMQAMTAQTGRTDTFQCFGIKS